MDTHKLPPVVTVVLRYGSKTKILSAKFCPVYRLWNGDILDNTRVKMSSYRAFSLPFLPGYTFRDTMVRMDIN